MTKVTGWDNGLCQDYDKGLGRWFANRLGARQQLRQDFKMTQVQYTVEPQGRPLAVMVSIATLKQLVVELQRMSNACELEGDKHRDGNKWHRLCDDADKALTAGRAALANAEQQVPQWLPIETAPQNEKVLLACDGGIVIGMWRHYRIHNAPKFTHWMPLPTPPKEAL